MAEKLIFKVYELCQKLSYRDHCAQTTTVHYSVSKNAPLYKYSCHKKTIPVNYHPMSLLCQSKLISWIYVSKHINQE